MSKGRTLNMTEGGIIKTMILFALPMIGSSIFQQLYSTADFLFVGNFLGSSAAAAVGASGTVVTCSIGLFTGIAVGAGVVIAQRIGSGDRGETRKALHTSLTFGAIAGVCLMLLGLIFARVVLILMNTPESVMTDAVLYMRLYFLSIPASILYNMCSGACRASGDSDTPFRVLVVCGFLNVAADALLICVIPLGVAGVAIATILCQYASLVLILRKLGGNELLAVKVSELKIDGTLLKEILRIGVPAGVQSMIVTFSNLLVQYCINGLGETAVAAFATYYKAENLIYLPIMAFGQAATTFSGQNTGAKKFDRVLRGSLTAMGLGIAVTLCISGAILAFPETVLGWFMKDGETVAATLKIALVSFPFYWIYPILECLGGALRGMGCSFSSMCITIGNMCGMRILLLLLFRAYSYRLESLALVYPVTWATCSACFILAFIIVITKRLRGKSAGAVETEGKIG